MMNIVSRGREHILFGQHPSSIRTIFVRVVFRAVDGNIEGNSDYAEPLSKVFLFDPLFKVTEARLPYSMSDELRVGLMRNITCHLKWSL